MNVTSAYRSTFLIVISWALCLEPGFTNELRISEFLASNQTSIEDADGDSPDWLELENVGGESVSLDGWFLTDDPRDALKWRFPNVELAPGEHLVVFASGKDRAVAGEELHTNFALSSGGEYVALLRPDASVASEFGPGGASFPPQLADVSYGTSEMTAETSLVAPGAALRTWVPADAALGDSWQGGDSRFDDSLWAEGTGSVGYETEEPQEPSVRLGVTEDLVLWLDATAGVTTDPSGRIERWQDQLAGEGVVSRDAVQLNAGSRPLLVEDASPAGDRSLVRFGDEDVGAPTWLEVPHRDELNPGTGGWTVFVVGSQSNTSGLWLGKGNDEAEQDGYSIFAESARLFVRAGSGDGPGATGGAQRASLPRTLAIVTCELTGTEVQGYLDGDSTAFRSGGGGTSGNSLEGEIGNPSALRIGAGRAADTDLQGDIAEILIYRRLLTPEERMEVEQYLADKWFLPAEVLAPNYRDVISADVESSLLDRSASIYVRVPFRVEDDPLTFHGLSLEMQYDDGFVAYLNGVEAARRAASGSVSWDSSATSSRPDTEALVYEPIDISSALEHLVPGDNLLAIHGLNASSGDDDFLLGARLSATSRTETIRYFPDPTPGAANGTGVLGFVEPPELSVERGFFDAPFELRMATATPGARIFYTTDGTKPTVSGFEYTAPVSIGTTTVVRARVFLLDHLPSTVATRSYLFLDHVTAQTGDGLPRGGNLQGDYALDPRVYNDPLYRDGFVDALRSLPTVSLVLDARNDLFGPSGIYTNPSGTGRSGERETSVEWMVSDASEEGFQVDAGIRIHGGAGRSHPKKSFRLFFRGEYGAARLNYPVHPGSPVDSYDRLVLRAGFNDAYSGSRFEPVGPQYLRDQFARRSHQDMGHLASRMRYVHFYINGLYWGLYDVTERINGAFASDHLGAAGPDDWDVMKHTGGDRADVLEGDREAWDRAQDIANGGLVSAEAYAEFQEHVDVDSLVDYVLLNFYLGGTDWPQNNWYALRPRLEGGRFTFAVWDAEITMSLRELRIDRTGVENRDTTGRLYSRCRENAEFRLLFADRAQRYLLNDGLLTPAVTANRYLSLAQQIDQAIIGESARWGDLEEREEPETRETWLAEQQRLLDVYMVERPPIVLEQFRDAGLLLDLPAPIFSQHGGRVPPGFVLDMSVSSGVIYFTLDGTDPRLEGGEVSPAAFVLGVDEQPEPLLAVGAEVRFLVPEDGSLALSWTEPDFDDSGWTPGQTGVGFETGEGFEELIATDLEESMRGVNASVYLRQEFTAPEALPRTMILRMKYDDGYAAYLNGQKVALRNAPALARWNTMALRSRVESQATVFEDVVIPEADSILRAGRNVLAIHALNSSRADGDFLVVPVIEVPPPPSEGSTVLERSVVVKARAGTNDSWSALTEARFSVGAGNLRITEIMYHPPAVAPGSPFEDEDFEYIEIQNVSSYPVNLMGVELGGGVDFRFEDQDLGAAQDLGPGEFVLLVKNLEAFESRYGSDGLYIAGEYGRRLSNEADRLLLRDGVEETVLDFSYEDWFPETDGGGFSLEIVDPLAGPETWGEEASWQPSAAVFGSPGRGIAVVLEGGAQTPGDANQDGFSDLSDAVRLLEHIFLGQPIDPPCEGETLADGANGAVMDLNGDARVNIADVIRLVRGIFGREQETGGECVRIVGCPDLGCE